MRQLSALLLAASPARLVQSAVPFRRRAGAASGALDPADLVRRYGRPCRAGGGHHPRVAPRARAAAIPVHGRSRSSASFSVAERPRQPQTQMQRALGSGVIVQADGHILTNHHVDRRRRGHQGRSQHQAHVFRDAGRLRRAQRSRRPEDQRGQSAGFAACRFR